MLVPPGVVAAVLALLEERKEQEADSSSTETNRNEGPLATDVRAAAFARLAIDAASLGVDILVVGHDWSFRVVGNRLTTV